MAVEASILDAFMTRINGLSLGLPIAWPNVDFDPPADGKYIAVSFIPNGANRVAISTDTPHRRIGLVQLSVYWPKGAGAVAPMEKADEVAAAFPADLRLTADGARVRVTKDADLSGPLVEDHALQIPVTVNWEAFA